ncbi:GGDEF domain-containing protein [Aestuariivirga sp.]|uniref:GGDEF domain-containing protein n=1 Tax=Aestuariivirga sp. TaxID=2650926 RepID=UPI0039E4C719
MRHTLRLVIAVFACGSAALAFAVIIHPAGTETLGSASAPPLLLGLVTVLLALTLFSTFLSILMPEMAASPPAPPVIVADEVVTAEIAKVANQLRSHLEANGLYATVLSKANTQLPTATTPEQLKVIVSYLMVENENMRAKASALQVNLEQSRRQVEHLRSSLAVTKAEVLSDSLTGLRNRRAFDFALASAVSEARHGSKPLSLVMGDIDHFKAVNDRFGHLAGDEVLKGFARILASNMKGRDTVARYGGEEFAIILPQTRLADAVTLAGQIRAQIEQTSWKAAGTGAAILKLTASFGVAELQDGENIEALLTRTDERLYEAKRQGRNRAAG